MTDFSLPTFLVSVETYPDHCCHLLYGPYVCAARNCQAASRVQRDPVHHVIQNILLFSSLALSSIHQLPNFRSNTEELLKHSLMAFSIRRTDQNTFIHWPPEMQMRRGLDTFTGTGPSWAYRVTARSWAVLTPVAVMLTVRYTLPDPLKCQKLVWN